MRERERTARCLVRGGPNGFPPLPPPPAAAVREERVDRVRFSCHGASSFAIRVRAMKSRVEPHFNGGGNKQIGYYDTIFTQD